MAIADLTIEKEQITVEKYDLSKQVIQKNEKISNLQIVVEDLGNQNQRLIKRLDTVTSQYQHINENLKE